MKVLFLHGLASSGRYKMASTLRILLKGSEVIAPDIPIDPDEALTLIRQICTKEQPDIIVGLSMGGFLAQKLRGFRKLLVNPDFHISRLLRTMKGEVKYLSPRADGALAFVITDEICAAYERLEALQFDALDEQEIRLTRACFADADELVRCGDEFAVHYPGQAVSYPGGHLPDFPQTSKYIAPVIRQMLTLCAESRPPAEEAPAVKPS